MADKVHLTDFELEVMGHIWNEGEAIAPEVHKKIAAGRPISYSAVKTIFDRLEEKGAIARSRTYGRTILYTPKIRREDAAEPLLRDMVRKMFGGELRPLMSHLAAHDDLSLDDIAYLERLIAKRKQRLEKDS